MEQERHRVVLTFDDGLYAKLICPGPGKGCQPATVCASCHRGIDSEGSCYDCEDGFPDDCWIKGWFDNLTPDELLHGEITVEIEADFDGETAICSVVAPLVQPPSEES